MAGHVATGLELALCEHGGVVRDVLVGPGRFTDLMSLLVRTVLEQTAPTSDAAGVEGAELLVAVLRHPRADGVDPYVPLEAEGRCAHEAFNAAVGDGEAGRLGDWIVEDVAGHERE